ncbi:MULTISPECIES: STAS domain-containing protein [Bacillus]|uniref:STAS domain-containing protein n=1 Tax=Bacillus TaxID=1386 RepID=UPI000BB8D60F|nr:MULTISPECIES: STAS domain-containing protein [Bacillus]
MEVNAVIGIRFKDEKEIIATNMLKELQKAYPENEVYKQEEQAIGIISIFSTLVDYIGEYISTKDKDILHNAKEWGSSIGQMAVSNGASLDSTLSNMTLYKKCSWNFLQQEGERLHLKLEELAYQFEQIDEVFNIIVFGFSQAFTKATDDKILETKARFLRLSVPIVPLLNGIAVLPLIGELDDERASILIEETLDKCKNLQINKLIIDFSGVYIVDQTVIHTIDLLIRALKLIGITPAITGLRAELSLQFVQSHLTLSDIELKGSLEQILEKALVGAK